MMAVNPKKTYWFELQPTLPAPQCGGQEDGLERSPSCLLAVQHYFVWPVIVPRPALVGGTASTQEYALAQPGHWAGLVEGPVLMTVGLARAGPLDIVPSRARFTQVDRPLWASPVPSLRPPLCDRLTTSSLRTYGTLVRRC